MKKKNELWLLVLWNIPAFFISYHYGSNYLITAALFFVLPSLYLTFRKPGMIRKISLASLAFVVPAVTVISYLAHTDGSWFNPSVLNIRFPHAYPLDDFIWGFLYLYYIFAVYEHFFERERVYRVPKRFLKYLVGIFSVSALFTLFVYWFGEPFIISYSYALIIVVLALLLPGIIFACHPRIFIKSVYAGLFFLPLSLLYEYVANIKGNWSFPGEHFIGYVHILSVSFPLEELAWVVAAVPAMTAYYEFIADDMT